MTFLTLSSDTNRLSASSTRLQRSPAQIDDMEISTDENDNLFSSIPSGKSANSRVIQKILIPKLSHR